MHLFTYYYGYLVSAKTVRCVFGALHKGAHFFMAESCCFIGETDKFLPEKKKAELSVCLTVLYSHLIFRKGVKLYRFIFFGDFFAVANPALELFFPVEPDLRRVLFTTVEEQRYISFFDSFRCRFEERRSLLLGNGDSLQKALIDESDYCIFYLDTQKCSPDSLDAFRYAASQGKKILNLFDLQRIGEVFSI